MLMTCSAVDGPEVASPEVRVVEELPEAIRVDAEPVFISLILDTSTVQPSESTLLSLCTCCQRAARNQHAEFSIFQEIGFALQNISSDVIAGLEISLASRREELEVPCRVAARSKRRRSVQESAQSAVSERIAVDNRKLQVHEETCRVLLKGLLSRVSLMRLSEGGLSTSAVSDFLNESLKKRKFDHESLSIDSEKKDCMLSIIRENEVETIVDGDGSDETAAVETHKRPLLKAVGGSLAKDSAATPSLLVGATLAARLLECLYASHGVGARAGVATSVQAAQSAAAGGDPFSISVHLGTPSKSPAVLCTLGKLVRCRQNNAAKAAPDEDSNQASSPPCKGSNCWAVWPTHSCSDTISPGTPAQACTSSQARCSDSPQLSPSPASPNPDVMQGEGNKEVQIAAESSPTVAREKGVLEESNGAGGSAKRRQSSRKGEKTRSSPRVTGARETPAQDSSGGIITSVQQRAKKTAAREKSHSKRRRSDASSGQEATPARSVRVTRSQAKASGSGSGSQGVQGEAQQPSPETAADKVPVLLPCDSSCSSKESWRRLVSEKAVAAGEPGAVCEEKTVVAPLSAEEAQAVPSCVPVCSKEAQGEEDELAVVADESEDLDAMLTKNLSTDLGLTSDVAVGSQEAEAQEWLVPRPDLEQQVRSGCAGDSGPKNADAGGNSAGLASARGESLRCMEEGGVGEDAEEGDDGSADVATVLQSAEEVEEGAGMAMDVEEEEEDEDEVLDEELEALYFIKRLPDVSFYRPANFKTLLPPKKAGTPAVTLVLDLDETLVHSVMEHCDVFDFSFPVLFNGHTHNVFVRRRPHLLPFLQRVSSLFEVVVFTASQAVYAEQLLDIIDPQRRFIHHRLFRDSCIYAEGNYVKDMASLGRELGRTVIVDNSPQAFAFQVNNGIPIEAWFDDPSDTELLTLLPFLEGLAKADDVRPLLMDKFKMKAKIDSLPDVFARIDGI